ncbi:uncharacterized protein LOC129583624 isoform X2 [Paramacrobiotus metropolitanus]|uniref:uncharacterized protein LOC129583624 isoform X2 n=1 Tax=Paramacrobiotus metropolitanus TaxID=2943436 RepID=UPI002445F1E8|nr:uncharacterized protein LOC129583624 isoform X2 [Paramacrobiotus metropolitanus]
MSDTISKYDKTETSITTTTTPNVPTGHVAPIPAGDEAARVAHAEANKNFLRHADMKVGNMHTKMLRTPKPIDDQMAFGRRMLILKGKFQDRVEALLRKHMIPLY